MFIDIWDKVFKNKPSKICRRQPLKHLKGYSLTWTDHTPKIFLKAVSHKFFLDHYWIPCPIYCLLKGCFEFLMFELMFYCSICFKLPLLPLRLTFGGQCSIRFKFRTYNYFYILRLFDVLPNFLFTTSQTMRDYYL